MPLSALALVIAAALLHALWNVAAKKACGNHHFVLMSAVLVTLVWAPAGVWVALDELGRWGWREWSLVWASGFAHLLYFNVLLKGYRVSDLSVVYPVARGTGPLLSAALSLLVLGEHMGLGGALGVLAVCGGIWLIAGGPALWRCANDPAQRVRVRAGLLWGALTGVLIASYTVVDGYAVKVLLVSPILVDYFGNLVRIPFMLPKCWRDRAAGPAAWRAQWRHALVVATLGPLAYVLVLYAARLAPLSHVAPAREVSMLFAALLGGRLLGEADRGLRLLGAAGMAVGVALLALG
ncbi:MAG: EamA family transporter [Vitreoscilla sp.]|nr:EamA family transporter [Vitreoscilla sp.]MBP6674188.1 EamA family transporter [Vitreoscilla sp.]